jgi:hypothetical protein
MSGEDNKRAVAEFVERCQNQGLLLGKLPYPHDGCSEVDRG